jgi:hypothetical protein
MIRTSTEDLDGNHRLLEFVVLARQMPLDDKAWESGQPLVAGESRARQHPSQLPPCGVYL